MATMTSWGFSPAESDSPALTARTGNDFVHFLNVVDDAFFVTHSHPMLYQLKKRLLEHFDVKFI